MQETIASSNGPQTELSGDDKIQITLQLHGQVAKDFLEYKKRVGFNTKANAAHRLITEALRQSSTVAA